MSFQILSKAKLKLFAQILDKKFRAENNVFLIEGVHLFEEFMKSDFEAEWIAIETDFGKTKRDLLTVLEKKFSHITYLTRNIDFRKLCDTKNSQGIVAAIKKRPINSHFSTLPGAKVVLALDRISDPGNMGTIIRTADWFGVNQIVLSPSCVEWHSPKTIRASMGSIFRVVGYENVNLGQFIVSMKEKNFQIYAADAKGKEQAKFQSPSVLIVGNESEGISRNLYDLCDRRIAISRYGQAESLNAAVACGILLNELTRQA